MNDAPGCVNVRNAVIPFGEFDTVHFARLVILDDQTVGDSEAYGMPTATYPRYLAFLGDVDGDGRTFLTELAKRSSRGLRAIFSCCEGFDAASDLLVWMRAHTAPSVAGYVNWSGRTVRAAREEADLREALVSCIGDDTPTFMDRTPREVHALLKRFVGVQVANGSLTLTPESPTPISCRLADIAHLIGVPLLLFVFSPILVIVAVVLLVRLRRLEKTDPEICPRPSAVHAEKLAVLEDRGATNQFTAMGSLKPGIARRWITTFLLWIVDYAARHFYTRGRLARVRSIHFARWVFLDKKKRLLFASNYDGSLESYMDDFINKVGFGLNLSFSNGIGYPRTNWLILDGCKDERKFKDYLRRHQLGSEVWYNAHAGRTAVEMERNTRIRQGLESSSMTDKQLAAWVSLL
jgi:hypothetical protein